MKSKYSLYGSANFDRCIETDLERIVHVIRQDPEAHLIKSIVLLGGYGRGEGTPFKMNGVEAPFNDYDLVIVTHRSSVNFAHRIRLMEKTLQKQIGIPVDLYPHSFSSLRRAEPSLLNYEMQKGHQVIWGESSALSVMPKISLWDLPLSEGTRLLMNRGKLLLQMRHPLLIKQPLTAREILHFRKFLWKNHLAFGDCLLLLQQDYDVSYEVKQKRMIKYRELEGVPHLSWAMSAYLKAISFKQHGELDLLCGGEDLLEEWRQTKECWLQFFLWFEGSRLGIQLNSSEEYCRELALREKRDIKSAIRNFCLFGRNMASPSTDWIWIHPRNRLYIALHLLLDRPNGSDLLNSLLGTQGGVEVCLERFYKVRSRLS